MQEKVDACAGFNSLPPIPLILVEGFLSTTGSVGSSPLRKYVGRHEDKLGERKVFVASVGPVSSLHDRACELYYAIKGGTEDYGEEHSRRFGHKRYGRHHAVGLYPLWSRANPLHFLGHSVGGATIIKLQDLLSIGFFGDDGHPDMVLSVTTVSAPFRGTQIVYSLGERTDSAPAVRPFSVGSAISKAVHILSYLSPLLPKIFDLHADSRALSYRESSFPSFLRHLWHSDWAEGRDATPFDVTFEAADERDANDEGHCHPWTFYTSYSAIFTRQVSSDSSKHAPHRSNILFPPLYLSAKSIGSFNFSTLDPLPSFFPQHDAPSEDVRPTAKAKKKALSACQDEMSEHYWANDGVVPVFSQWHPRDCASTKCMHHKTSALLSTQRAQKRIEPGVWNVYTLERAHHLSLLPLWVGSSCQVEFWTDLGDFLRDIDAQQFISGSLGYRN